MLGLAYFLRGAVSISLSRGCIGGSNLLKTSSVHCYLCNGLDCIYHRACFRLDDVASELGRLIVVPQKMTGERGDHRNNKKLIYKLGMGKGKIRRASESMNVNSLTHHEQISRNTCILGLAFISVYRGLIILLCLSRDATLSRHRGIRLNRRFPPFPGAVGS